MIRVLIADDHPIVRKGLRTTLSEVPDISVVDEAADGLEVADRMRASSPDVVLLDLSLPGRHGFDVLVQLQKEFPRVHVLILSTYPEKQYAVRCLRAGARGYVTKESAPGELIAAIRKVSTGRTYVSATLAETLASELAVDHTRLPHEELSDREFQVLILLGNGKTVSEIAAELSLAVNTVATYRARVLAKLNLETNAQLMLYVLEHHLDHRR